ncbi:MAG: DUF1385 domain-containing protein [Armatimonadota bacterium]
MPNKHHTKGVILDRLNQPAGRFMRPCPVAETFSSVAVAAERMESAGLAILPIVRDGRYVGVLTQAAILVSLAADESSPVGDYARDWLSIPPYVTGAEAMRKLEAASGTLIVVADDGEVCGILTASAFLHSDHERVKPPIVGGMATPFGVYLTTGAVNAGRKGWNLMLTGGAMFSAMLVGEMIYLLVSPRISPGSAWLNVLALLPIVSLVVMFRLFPLSGYHAAEHQVVHAIEQDEPLLPDVVRRMPRVHPRCGTNIGVAISLFLGVSQSKWIPYEELRLLMAVLVTLFFWRPLGSFAQQYITTKPATPKQIQSGIDAAHELLLNYEQAPNRKPTPFGRLLNSGVLHVIAGSFLAYLIASLLAVPLGIKFGDL